MNTKLGSLLEVCKEWKMGKSYKLPMLQNYKWYGKAFELVHVDVWGSCSYGVC